MRPHAWWVALVGGVGAAATTRNGEAEAAGAIVLFIADGKLEVLLPLYSPHWPPSTDLGWNDLGYRNAALRTPTIDALRNESVSLADYYVQQVCSPTRAALLTARFPHRLGSFAVIHASEPMGVPLDVPMLSNALSDAGFESHLLGKWHVGMYRPELLPINRGFRGSAFGYLCGSTSYWTHGNTESFCPGEESLFLLDLTNGSVPALGEHGGRWNGTYDTEMYTGALQEILQGGARNRSKRLFLCAEQRPHTTRSAAKLRGHVRSRGQLRTSNVQRRCLSA